MGNEEKKMGVKESWREDVNTGGEKGKKEF